METAQSPKIAIQLFVGCPLTPELRRQLHQSAAWKEAKLALSQNGEHLVEVHHQNKGYIGKSLKQSTLPFEEFQQIQTSILKSLEAYCPEVRTDQISIVIFPQLFIG